MALLKLQTALENALAPQSRFKPLVLAVDIWAPCVPGRAQSGGRIFCEDAESLCLRQRQEGVEEGDCAGSQSSYARHI